MTKESVALGVSGVLFGFLTGWIIGAQQARPAPAAAPVAAAAPAPGPAAPAGQGGAPAEPPKLDQAKLDTLRKRAADNPRDAAVRAEIGNVYFDAERYPEAITWYEASLGLDAKNVDVSTDLGVSYYYANQADRALSQFEHSLQIAPKHTKTMLNIGVVRAFGKQDLTGAASIWQQVVDIAPDSNEGRAAKRMIEAVRSAHPDTGGTAKPQADAGPATPQENGAP